jgi:hypothetical protein
MKLHSLCGSTAVTVLAMAAGFAQAAVPPVDQIGQPAIVVCKVLPNGVQVRAVHMDKIIFRITGELDAVNANDQAQLDAVPRNTKLDIKVLDDPRTVADLRAKVLTFLGAALTPANRISIVVDEVAYAVVCPNPDAAGGGG